jgi:hypothetical protein
MANLDLQGLINEILGMVRDRNKNAPSATDKADEEYWKDIRKRNTDLEIQKNAIAGQTGLEGVKSAGELARQRLAGENAINVAEITGRAHEGAAKYTADKNLESHKKLVQPEQLKAYSAVLSDITSPEEDKATARRLIFKNYGEPTTDNLRSFDDNKDISATIPSSSAVSTPPIRTPGGAKSMEFGFTESPMNIPVKKKHRLENYLTR